MEGWDGFAAAQIGAAAALAGLIFVGISVNLQRILSGAGLTARAAEALFVLLALLVAASLLLVPDQSPGQVGWELLLLGTFAWAFVVAIHRRARGDWQRSHPWSFASRIALGQLATVPFILAGLGVLLRGAGGMAWFALGTVGVYLFAFSNAWTLLVEIDR